MEDHLKLLKFLVGSVQYKKYYETILAEICLLIADDVLYQRSGINSHLLYSFKLYLNGFPLSNRMKIGDNVSTSWEKPK
jgi:hypothetical protein